MDIKTRTYLENLGIEKVQSMVGNGGWPVVLHKQAMEWLTEKRSEPLIQQKQKRSE